MSGRNRPPSFPDRVLAWVGAPARRHTEALPGPRGLAAYARVGWTRAPVDALTPRLRLLVSQLAAVRSGCDYCAQYNRHLGLRGGLPGATLNAVTEHVRAPDFSDQERAALALADALTGFVAAEGGFAVEVLVRARCHLPEEQIMALVGLVATEHFYDPVTGALGRDAVAARR